MKMQMFRQSDCRLESRFENCSQAPRGKLNVDPMTLQLAAQQEERKRIAQELHDTLLQGFTGIGLKLEALVSSLPPSLAPFKA
jgi:signal transduction histidine kinase